MEELKKEYAEITAQIQTLKQRKGEIERLMIGAADTFMEKFRLWYNNDDEGHHDSIIDSPILRKMLDKKDYHRYETVHLESLIDYEDFEMLLYPEDISEYAASEEAFKEMYDEALERLQPALQEAMDTNMKSFTLDW